MSATEITADFDAVIARAEGSMALDERLRVAGALLGKGEALVGVGRYDAAVTCYGQVLARVGASEEPEIGKQVRVALARKGSVLLRLDRVDEAHAVFDE